MLMQANAIQMPLKDESVQCCAFSPPYWGLRKYEDLPPLIWNGIEGCEHEWRGTCKKERHNKLWATNSKPENCYDNQQAVPQGQFCQLCNAWRGDLGLEPTPELYLDHMMLVMAEVWRVLRDDGCCFCNIGDSYWGGKGQSNYAFQERRTSQSIEGDAHNITGIGETRPQDGKHNTIKPKSLCLVPQKLAIRCQEAGWIIRSEIIWAKPNPMPESVKDRPTRSHEQVWMMTKQGRYYWDQDAVREANLPQSEQRYEHKESLGLPKVWTEDNGKGIPISGGKKVIFNLNPKGRNIRDVWTIATEPTPEAHFATWPSKLVNRMIRAATAQKACPHCRAPWEQNITRKANYTKRELAHAPKSEPTKVDSTGWKPPTITYNGWQPTCKCEGNDGSGKCIVLDPFGGTCKTVLEAERLNRTGIGLDLSYTYLSEIAKPRQDVPLQRVLM